MILCNEFTTVVHAFLLTFAFAFASRRNVIVCTKRRPAIDGSHSTLEARCNKKKKVNTSLTAYKRMRAPLCHINAHMATHIRVHVNSAYLSVL